MSRTFGADLRTAILMRRVLRTSPPVDRFSNQSMDEGIERLYKGISASQWPPTSSWTLLWCAYLSLSNTDIDHLVGLYNSRTLQQPCPQGTQAPCGRLGFHISFLSCYMVLTTRSPDLHQLLHPRPARLLQQRRLPPHNPKLHAADRRSYRHRPRRRFHLR